MVSFLWCITCQNHLSRTVWWEFLSCRNGFFLNWQKTICKRNVPMCHFVGSASRCPGNSGWWPRRVTHSSYVTLISIIQAFPFLTLQLCTWRFDLLEPVGGRGPSNRWWGWICHLHSRGCGWLLQVTPGLGVLVTEQNPLYPKLESATGRLFLAVLS